MSESLGLKAVSRVAETDRFPFLKALAHIATVDDSVDLDEKELVQQYETAWDLGEEAKAEVERILEAQKTVSIGQLLSEFSEAGTRLLLVQELMRLAYADGTYGDAERREIARIARDLGLTEEQFRELEKWVHRGQAWGETSDEDGPSEEDLKKVLNRSNDSSEHDLSDIQTGESDLSDIGSEFSELDPSAFDEEIEEEDESDDT